MLNIFPFSIEVSIKLNLIIFTENFQKIMLKQKHLGLLVTLIAMVMFLGCTSKKYAKLALKNEQAGLFEDAAELYLKSLTANKNNIEAKIGARKNGQITLDKKLAEFTKAYSSGQTKNAVYYYLNTKKYFEKFASSGVELDMAPQYEEQFNEAKKQHVEERYKEALTLLNNEKFAESETILNEIISLENNYKDTKELLKTAHYEPLYRNGKTHLDNKMFRKAYYVFDNIIKGTGNYKEAAQFKQDALTAAQFTIWIKDIENYNDPAAGAKLKSAIISQLNNSRDPFIKIIENPSVVDNSQKNKKSFFDIVNKNTNAQNLKIDGVKAILIAKIDNIQKAPSALNTKIMKGYIKSTKTNANGQRIDEFRKVEYKEFFQSSYTQCFFKFQLVSTENGAVLASDAATIQTQDEVRYATYNGDYSNLVPGFWKFANVSSPEDRVNNNFGEVQNLQSLFRAQRNIKSIETLQNELIEKMAKVASQRVINYNPEN